MGLSCGLRLHRVSKAARDLQGGTEYTGCSQHGGRAGIPHGAGAVHIHAVPTLCAAVASPTAFGRYQTGVRVIQLHEVSGRAGFRMFGAHDTGLVPLVDNEGHGQ